MILYIIEQLSNRVILKLFGISTNLIYIPVKASKNFAGMKALVCYKKRTSNKVLSLFSINQKTQNICSCNPFANTDIRSFVGNKKSFGINQ